MMIFHSFVDGKSIPIILICSPFSLLWKNKPIERKNRDRREILAVTRVQDQGLAIRQLLDCFVISRKLIGLHWCNLKIAY